MESESGMVFKILTPSGSEIEDPDTGESHRLRRLRESSCQSNFSAGQSFGCVNISHS